MLQYIATLTHYLVNTNVKCQKLVLNTLELKGDNIT